MPYFTKDLKKARRPIDAARERRQVGNVRSGLRRPALPCARSGLLRMAGRSRWQTPFAVARIDGEPVVFGASGKGGSPRRGKPSRRLRPSPRMQPAARRNTGPMPVIIERKDWPSGWARPKVIPPHCCARHQRMSCGSGRSGRPSATSEQWARAAQAINYYGADAALMHSSRFA